MSKEKEYLEAKKKDICDRSDGNKVQESEMDVKIDSAMKKIIQDTLGSQNTAGNSEDNKKKKSDGNAKGKRKRRRRKKMGVKIAACFLGVAVILAGAVYGAGVYYYKDKFMKGTSINHILCENMTVQQAEEQIRDKVEDYSVEVMFRNGQNEKIYGQDMGYEYVSDKSVEKFLKAQNPFTWPKGYFKENDYKAGENIRYDRDALRARLEAFDCMKPENMEAPADAYISFENNQFVIHDEVQGNTVQEEVILEALENAVSTSQKSVSVEEAGAYAVPAVTRDDEGLIHQRDVWNSCAAVTVVYTFGDTQVPLDGTMVKDWMTYDENGNYVENPQSLEAHVANFVAWLADNYDTAGKDRVITSTATGQPVTVKGGNYGFKIDQLKEKEQLLSDITNHVSVAREPVYSKTGKVYAENDVGDTYMEIDLTSQHLWYYKEGSLFMDTDFVSGTYVMPDRRTPGGSYSLVYKQKDQVLRGTKMPDGSYAYEQPVKYWMPFNGGIGLHDANWRYRFGGNIYKSSGSHGCINLPTDAAKTIYENIEAGCPILCFYRE